MGRDRINRVTARIMSALSLLAVLLVTTGYFQAPEPDEGAAAHIFQISILALVAALFIFLITADWKQPLRRLRTLAFPLITIGIAFAELYYLEHVFYATH